MVLRILVADDDYVTGFDLCETIEEAGYAAEGPHAGICAAMLACQKEKPDLAILDIALIDGLCYELAQKLINENVPVILHSERADASAVAARFPQATTLARPCPPAMLLDVVSRSISDAR